MLKLQDFAAECGISDRQVQRLLKKYAEDLEGHYERKGNQGTWLDDEAQEYLRSKMKQQPVVVSDNAHLREIERLQAKIEQLEGRIDLKDMLIMKLQEDANIRQDRLIQLEKERLLIESKAQEDIKAAEDRLTLQYRHEMELLKQELDNERKRPLSLKERLTGRKR